MIFMRYVCPNMVIMPLYGHVYLISICKLSIICINSESRHVIVTSHIGNVIMMIMINNMAPPLYFKVVLGGYHRIFFEVKVKTVKLIGGRRYLAVRIALNVKTYSKSISRLLVCLQPPAANKLHFLHPKVVTTFLENGSVETNSIPLC